MNLVDPRTDIAPKLVLMSIKPQYAQPILDGTKTIELRRRGTSIRRNDLIFIYESSPTSKVVGLVEAGWTCHGPADWLWDRYGKVAGVTREEFDAYFEGCDRCHGITLNKPERIEPITLNFHPPQSYLFLDNANLKHREFAAIAQARLREAKAAA